MRRYVIVGAGIAGMTAAQAIVRADPAAELRVLGAESYPYYRRPQLCEFVAGVIEQEALYFRPLEWYAARGIQVYLGAHVITLDPAEHRLALADGSSVQYDRLLLATGARSFVPPFAGAVKAGVFTLRTLNDALVMRDYAREVPSAAVIGGGLLGLETARALRTAGLEVTVIEFAPHLLPRQLDAEGAEVLQSLLEAQGLRILTGAVTEAILGAERAMGVQLKACPERSRRNGRVVDGELVLISTGIRSRVELARAAGLGVNQGVIVDERLCTSAADGSTALTTGIYAAGDAAEFEGRVYGLVTAATEQAQVAAANMVAPGSATYRGTMPATTLKIAGVDLTCLGQTTAAGDEFVIRRRADPAAGVYRRLALRGGKIVGAILLGDTRDVRPLRQLIASGRDVSAHSERLLDKDFDLKALANHQLTN